MDNLLENLCLRKKLLLRKDFHPVMKHVKSSRHKIKPVNNKCM